MRIVEVNIDQIIYEDKEISDLLFQSVERIGLSFPVKLKIEDDHYICVDGNKRIKILKQLKKEKVAAIIMNNGNNRSNDCWRDMNHH